MRLVRSASMGKSCQGVIQSNRVFSHDCLDRFSGADGQGQGLRRPLGKGSQAFQHIAQHDHRGAAQLLGLQGVHQVPQLADGMPLLGQTDMLDDGQRRVGGQARSGAFGIGAGCANGARSGSQEHFSS